MQPDSWNISEPTLKMPVGSVGSETRVLGLSQQRLVRQVATCSSCCELRFFLYQILRGMKYVHSAQAGWFAKCFQSIPKVWKPWFPKARSCLKDLRTHFQKQSRSGVFRLPAHIPGSLCHGRWFTGTWNPGTCWWIATATWRLRVGKPWMDTEW